MMVDKALAIAHYTGKKQDAARKLGVGGDLKKYYYFNMEDGHKKAVDFQFITCKIEDIEGHVWVEIKMLNEDDNKEEHIISLWYIEYRIYEWCVVRILDTPWISKKI